MEKYGMNIDHQPATAAGEGREKAKLAFKLDNKQPQQSLRLWIITSLMSFGQQQTFLRFAEIEAFSY